MRCGRADGRFEKANHHLHIARQGNRFVIIGREQNFAVVFGRDILEDFYLLRIK